MNTWARGGGGGILCQNLCESQKKTKVDEPVPGFQIEENGTFHFLNAWNRLGVDEPIR